MRTFAAIISTLVLTTLAANAQPHLGIETFFQLGELPLGRVAELEIPFRNDGDQTLTIEAVTPDCGCVVSDLESADYPPGAEGRINVSFDSTLQQVGPITKQITITSNAPTRQITLAATLFKTIAATPPLVLFTSRTEDLEQEVLIEGSSADFQVLGAELEGEGFTLELQSVGQGQALLKVELVPQLLPVPIWDYGANARIETSDPDQPILQIPLYVRLRAPFRALPSMVFFYAKKFGETHEIRVALDSKLGNDLEIMSMRSSLDFIEVERDFLRDDPGILVRLLPSAPLGRFAGELVLESNIESMPVLTLDINGTIID